MKKLVDKQQVQVRVLKQAAIRLREALRLTKTDIARDAVIQRFEFTFELT